MPTIIITDHRFGNHYLTGINGLYYDLPVDVPIEIEDLLVDQLETLACEFHLVGEEAGAMSTEGSPEDMVPIIVEPPAPTIAEAAYISDCLVAEELGADPPEPPVTSGGGDPMMASRSKREADDDDESLGDKVKGKLGLGDKKK